MNDLVDINEFATNMDFYYTQLQDKGQTRKNHFQYEIDGGWEKGR